MRHGSIRTLDKAFARHNPNLEALVVSKGLHRPRRSSRRSRVLDLALVFILVTTGFLLVLLDLKLESQVAAGDATPEVIATLELKRDVIRFAEDGLRTAAAILDWEGSTDEAAPLTREPTAPASDTGPEPAQGATKSRR